MTLIKPKYSGKTKVSERRKPRISERVFATAERREPVRMAEQHKLLNFLISQYTPAA